MSKSYMFIMRGRRCVRWCQHGMDGARCRLDCVECDRHRMDTVLWLPDGIQCDRHGMDTVVCPVRAGRCVGLWTNWTQSGQHRTWSTTFRTPPDTVRPPPVSTGQVRSALDTVHTVSSVTHQTGGVGQTRRKGDRMSGMMTIMTIV